MLLRTLGESREKKERNQGVGKMVDLNTGKSVIMENMSTAIASFSNSEDARFFPSVLSLNKLCSNHTSIDDEDVEVVAVFVELVDKLQDGCKFSEFHNTTFDVLETSVFLEICA